MPPLLAEWGIACTKALAVLLMILFVNAVAQGLGIIESNPACSARSLAESLTGLALTFLAIALALLIVERKRT